MGGAGNGCRWAGALFLCQAAAARESAMGKLRGKWHCRYGFLPGLVATGGLYGGM